MAAIIFLPEAQDRFPYVENIATTNDWEDIIIDDIRNYQAPITVFIVESGATNAIQARILATPKPDLSASVFEGTDETNRYTYVVGDPNVQPIEIGAGGISHEATIYNLCLLKVRVKSTLTNLHGTANVYINKYRPER